MTPAELHVVQAQCKCIRHYYFNRCININIATRSTLKQKQIRKKDIAFYKKLKSQENSKKGCKLAQSYSFFQHIPHIVNGTYCSCSAATSTANIKYFNYPYILLLHIFVWYDNLVNKKIIGPCHGHVIFRKTCLSLGKIGV